MLKAVLLSFSLAVVGGVVGGAAVVHPADTPGGPPPHTIIVIPTPTPTP